MSDIKEKGEFNKKNKYKYLLKNGYSKKKK